MRRSSAGSRSGELSREMDPMVQRGDWAVIDVVEAIYRLEASEEQWLEGILEALATRIGGDCGVGTVLYDVSGEAGLTVERMMGLGVSEEYAAAGLEMHSSPEFVAAARRGYRSLLYGSAAEFPSERVDAMRSEMRRFGIRDQFIMNGIDPAHRGCAAYVFSSRELRYSHAQRALLARVSTHLATAYRLRRRLALVGAQEEQGVEAVLYPDGRIEHAEGPAQQRDVRDALGAAVHQRERALGRLRREDPPRALEQWQTMVQGRWTLVDYGEGRGLSRRVLARENLPAMPDHVPLSRREDQVAALAALGRSNKLIAYELGLAHSTIRVLLGRAVAKLGLRSRAELVAHYHRQLASDGGASEPGIAP